MRPVEFPATALAEVLRRQKIATIDEAMAALGTSSKSTVFRKLRELACHTSYSHRGSYYALEEVADFNELGLWSFRQVWFSIYGTLLSTAMAVVEADEWGYLVCQGSGPPSPSARTFAGVAILVLE